MASRRGILKAILVFGGAWVVMARPWNWVMTPAVNFAPLDGLAPFRALETGRQVSGGSAAGAVLIGLDPPVPRDLALEERLRGTLTQTLWSDWVPGDAGPVPVTYFTDLQCPICRVLDRSLDDLSGIALTTREFPIFGPSSDMAAKAIVAASAQGQGEAMRSRLHRVPVTMTRETIEGAASTLPLDVEQLLDAMDGPEVAARLAEDRALARIFGLPGTPALVVGRTLVVGAIPTQQLEDLVAIERSG